MGSSIMRIITFLLVLSMPFNGHAQNVFNVAFDVNNAPNLSSNVVETQDGYIFTQRADYNGFSHIQAIKLDTLGNLLDSNSIVQSYNALFYGYAGSLQKLSNDEYCQLYKVGPDSSLRLVFFDENLNILNNMEYNLGLFSAPGLINQINDSTILILGQVTNPSAWDLVLINTDLQGNERWRTIFGEPSKDDYGFAIEYVNNNVIIGSQTLITSSISHPHLYKFTPAGVLVLDTIYSEYYAGGYFFSHPNYGWYLSAAKKTTSNYYPVLLKLNNDFTVNFSKAYFSNEKYVSVGFHSINDDGVITSAGLQIVNNITTGFFFQANHKGDSLGSKLINHNLGELSQFHDIRPTSDGGYIMAGQTRAPTQDSWIVKVNAWGCDNIPCIVSVPEVPEKEEGFLTCFPNPTNSGGVVKGYISNVKNSNTQIRIYNSIGQLIITMPVDTGQFQLDIQLPAKGLYFIVLYQNNNILNQQKWVVQ